MPPNIRALPPLKVQQPKPQQEMPPPAPVVNPPVQQPPVAQQMTQHVAQQAPPQQVPPTQVVPPPVNSTLEESTDLLQEMTTEQTGTYLSTGTRTHGYVEFDLMSHRQKGNEVRYLSIQMRGFSMDDADRGKECNVYISIVDKEDFERIKSFFTTLKWED